MSINVDQHQGDIHSSSSDSGETFTVHRVTVAKLTQWQQDTTSAVQLAQRCGILTTNRV